MYLNSPYNVTLSNVTFNNNSANVIKGNSESGLGGGLYYTCSNVLNCLVTMTN